LEIFWPFIFIFCNKTLSNLADLIEKNNFKLMTKFLKIWSRDWLTQIFLSPLFLMLNTIQSFFFQNLKISSWGCSLSLKSTNVNRKVDSRVVTHKNFRSFFFLFRFSVFCQFYFYFIKFSPFRYQLIFIYP
jgi:hypothetical protein